MPSFKAGDKVVVLDNEHLIGTYSNKVIAGKRCKVVSGDNQDGYDGYHVEYTSPRGFSYTHFVRSDHLIPDNSTLLSAQKPNWLKSAEEWQNKLWKKHLE